MEVETLKYKHFLVVLDEFITVKYFRPNESIRRN